MDKDGRRKAYDRTRRIVRIAVLSAALTVFKLALSFIPNVELVTVLLVAYGSALGMAYALPASLVFCAVEVAIYGVGSWVLLYFIYWPLLAAVASVALKGRRVALAVIISVAGSALFGVLSACADTVFVAASLAPSRLGAYFVAYYIRGLYFDVAHMASSLVTVAILYVPLVGVLKRAARDAYIKNTVYSGEFLSEEYKREDD